MKFDIFNKTTKQAESGVYSDNARMLMSIYKMVGEDIEILKTYADSDEDRLDEVPVTPQLPIQQTMALPTNSNIINKDIPISEKKPSKIFNDNNTLYKIEDNVLYKQSWVNVEDISQYRLLNEKNKEIKLSDKTLQTLGWVKIG